MCKQESSSDESRKIYTRKELVMMETNNYDFHMSFYIPDIQALTFHLPHVHILVTNQCVTMRRTAFKLCELFKNVLCHQDYAERVIVSFDHQIQSEYCGGNRSVSIEGIKLERFSALPKADINSTKSSRQQHAVFQPFLSDGRKKDSATTTAHIKLLISLIKDKKVLTTSFSTI